MDGYPNGQLDLLAQQEYDKLEKLPKLVANSGIAFMPFFPDELASLPVHIGRSGVFSPATEEEAKFYHDAVFYKDENIILKYSGHSLNQDDADVFMTVLRLTKGGKTGRDGRIRTLRSTLLSELGWTRAGKSYSRLLSSIKRLTESLFYYETLGTDSDTPISRSHPLRMFEYELTQGEHYVIWIPRESMMLFEQNGFLNWEKRQSIGARNGLAKSIQLYSSSLANTNTVRMMVAELKDITRTKSPENKFRVSLQRAFEELERVQLIENSWINKDGKDWYCGWNIK